MWNVRQEKKNSSVYMPYSAASFVEVFGGGATRGIDCNITTSIYFLLNALTTSALDLKIRARLITACTFSPK